MGEYQKGIPWTLEGRQPVDMPRKGWTNSIEIRSKDTQYKGLEDEIL